MTPSGGFALAWLAIAGLACAARRLPAQVLAPRAGSSTRPLWYGVLAAVNMTLVFVIVFVLPEANPPWLPPWPATFAFVAVVDGVTLWLILRWSGNGSDWDDRHKLALVMGMLAFFIAFDLLQDLTEGFGGLSIVAVVTLWGLWRLWTRTQVRYACGGARSRDEQPLI